MGKEVRDDKGQRAIDSCLLRVLCAFGSQLDKQIVSGQRTDMVRVSCLLQVTVKGSSQQSKVFQLFNCQATSLKHRWLRFHPTICVCMHVHVVCTRANIWKSKLNWKTFLAPRILDMGYRTCTVNTCSRDWWPQDSHTLLWQQGFTSGPAQVNKRLLSLYCLFRDQSLRLEVESEWFRR